MGYDLFCGKTVNLQKGYEILDERVIFHPHKNIKKINLNDHYWKMSMWIWDDPKLPDLKTCHKLIESTNEPHTGKNFIATTQRYDNGYVKPHQDRGTFSIVSGNGRKLQVLDIDSEEWIDVQHVILLGKYGAEKLGGHAPFHRVEPSTGFSLTLQVGPDNLPFLWSLPDNEATDSYRYGSEVD